MRNDGWTQQPTHVRNQKPHLPRWLLWMKWNFDRYPASIAIARAYIAQAHGDVSATVQYTRRALDLVPEADYLWYGTAACLLGLAHWSGGDLVAAHKSLSDGMAEMQMAGNIPFATSVSFVLADIRAAQGRLNEAVRIYQQSLQLALAQGQPFIQGTADMYLGLSELHHLQGDMETARQHLLKSEELGESSGLPDWPYRLSLVQAQLKEAEGDLDGALALLNEAERLYYINPRPNVRPVAAMKARVWIKLGRLAEASDWVQGQGLSVDDDVSYLRVFEHVHAGAVACRPIQKQPGR